MFSQGKENDGSMKKYTAIIIMTILLLAVSIMTSCGKIELTVMDNTEKAMTIVAEKAAKDELFTAGTLVVDKGEEIEITSELENGIIELGFVGFAGMDDNKNATDTKEGPKTSFAVSGNTTQICQLEKGTYSLEAVVKQKATGTIRVEVKKVK